MVAYLIGLQLRHSGVDLVAYAANCWWKSQLAGTFLNDGKRSVTQVVVSFEQFK
jgi:hypothetical protein